MEVAQRPSLHGTLPPIPQEEITIFLLLLPLALESPLWTPMLMQLQSGREWGC